MIFDSISWFKCNIVVDEETQEELSFNWHIDYSCHNSFAAWSGNYVAEQAQLPAEPTEDDAKALILSLYPEGYLTSEQTA